MRKLKSVGTILGRATYFKSRINLEDIGASGMFIIEMKSVRMRTEVRGLRTGVNCRHF
jgi:hypothetical protein